MKLLTTLICTILSTGLYAQPCAKSPSFYAVGASFNKAATPNLAGIFAVGVPITCESSSFQAYSYTEHNLVPIGVGKNLTFKEVTSTGFATPLKQIGPIDIFGFGNIGVATEGASASLAGAYGAMAVFPLWARTSWRGVIAAQKVDGNNIFSAAIGRSWQ